jgi:lysophospholipase L1-like esterase
MAYEPLVVENLSGRAEVWGPVECCGTSRYVLEHLEDWVLSRPADVVHMNCGLHDLAIDSGEGNRVPLEEYVENLRAIVERISAESAGRLVWATTTPVIDEWHQRVKSFRRREADVLRYNAAAFEVMCEGESEINHLHEVIRRADPERCLRPDGVHMNEHGNLLLAEAVAAAIMASSP